MTLLKPGTYRLTATLVNPSPDRRYKRLWSAKPTFEAGTIFIVDYWTDRFNNDSPTLEIYEQGSYRHDAAPDSNALFKLIALHLEPVVEMPSDYLTRVGWNDFGANVLDQMAKDGVITVEQVAAALAKYLAE